MNTTSLMNAMASTKDEVQRFVSNAKNEILSGHENVLKIAVQLKAMEDTIEALRKDPEIKDAFIREAEKNGKTFKLYGAEFQVKETGVKYDYSICNDSTYNELTAKMEALKNEIKSRETFLKSITHSIEAVDTKTGEMLNPPVKTSTTTVTITLK